MLYFDVKLFGGSKIQNLHWRASYSIKFVFYSDAIHHVGALRLNH